MSNGYKFINEWIQSNGDLSDHCKYAYWQFGNIEVTLDGSFTLGELKEIVQYMQSNTTKKGKRWPLPGFPTS